MIKIKKSSSILSSGITPEPIYLRRREFMKASGMRGNSSCKQEISVSTEYGEVKPCRRTVTFNQKLV
jgi:hypothetical protein